MKSKLAMVAATGLLLGVMGGCKKAESPSEVQHDVAEARQDAAAKVADVSKDVSEDVADSAAKVAEGGREITVAVAEGDHKVAIEKCEALAGDAQKVCKDQADAAFQTAQANAEARAVAASPK
jgi:hypothetical protein